MRAESTRGAYAGSLLLLLVVAASTLGAWLWPNDPDRTLEPAVAALAVPGDEFRTIDLVDGRRLAARRLRTEGTLLLLEDGRAVEQARLRAAPGAQRFWLGSDRFGRDVAARVLAGGRLSLTVAAASLALALALGVPLGLAAGLAGGRAGGLLLAVIEAAQAFPRLFLVVAIAAVLSPSAASAVWILALTGWMPIARLVRAETRRLKTSEFVLAARAIGAGPLRVAFRHVLPNTLAPVFVEASLGMAGAVASEAALSFLGLGAQPPAASWGSLIADGRDLLFTAPWISVAPGGALALTVFACNLLAESLRDRFDPRAKGRVS